MNRFFLLIACIIFSASTVANGFEVDGVYYWITNDTIQPFSVEVRQPKYGFYSAKKVEIPSSIVYSGNTYIVTSISGIAFLGASITELTIPSSVTRIFGVVDGLYADNIVIHAITPPDTYCSSIYSMRNKTLYVPKESLRNYANAEGWKEFGRILPIGGDGSIGVFKPDFDPKNKVKGVAGCSFGCDSKQAINHFNNKFGYYAINNSYETTYADVYFAGYYFDIMELQFVDNKPKQRKDFASIEFQKIFDANDYEAAKRCFESIRKMYSEKYSNEREYEEGWYMYGMIEEDYHNTVPPIILGIEKGVGGDGNERYYIMIHYYGFRTLDRYSDDI